MVRRTTFLTPILSQKVLRIEAANQGQYQRATWQRLHIEASNFSNIPTPPDTAMVSGQRHDLWGHVYLFLLIRFTLLFRPGPVDEGCYVFSQPFFQDNQCAEQDLKAVFKGSRHFACL